MLLTVTTTHEPATDLGYLLHKNPSRTQSFELSFGKAHVLYPEATPARCTAALILEVDPIGLVRRKEGAAPLEQYVNDRPYVASSFLSVAMSQVFGTAMSGRSKDRPKLAETAIPLEATIAVLPCRGGEDLLRRLFEPLGYVVDARPHVLDPAFPDWGDSRYFTVTLTGRTRVADLLRHIYVLVPVLDDSKHYWVGDDEVEKLLSKGEDWLGAHPERELIARRYLRHRGSLARAALARLVAEEVSDPEEEAQTRDAEEGVVEERIGLNDVRLRAVADVLRASGASRVVDLGCGEGRLLGLLLQERAFEEILGMDVSIRSLEIASTRLHLERLPPKQRDRIRLIHGSLMYRDHRIAGYDAAAVVEVIEHLDPPRLHAFERVVFEFARPVTAVVTTPNREYNAKFERLPAGDFRHRDHRFEWTREEFRAWAEAVSNRHGYAVRFLPIGPEDEQLGAPTQMGIFTRVENLGA
ncbi:MAG TPA: 3' terminal RNA ribose 2'-O-methyltransferase Hen1 [Longimicrobiales bacterium]|nr:3' terminal RNA ribose 2'-O-methyltransferase Hen1 [Longimicrobiales bacterium]